MYPMCLRFVLVSVLTSLPCCPVASLCTIKRISSSAEEGNCSLGLLPHSRETPAGAISLIRVEATSLQLHTLF